MSKKKLFNIPAEQGGSKGFDGHIVHCINPGNRIPLKVPDEGLSNIALHIPVCFEDIPHITERSRDSQIKYLKENLKETEGMDIYISINGEPLSEKWTKEVYDIAAGCSKVKEVFKRNNTGYQWGGYYDMYKKYRDEYDWFATLEVDYGFKPNWRSYASPCRKLGHLGLELCDGRNRPAKYQRLHTEGGMHLCVRDLLDKIDKKFGCFTESTGSDHEIDGILLGEIGFCQKIIAVGSVLNPVPMMCFRRY